MRLAAAITATNDGSRQIGAFCAGEAAGLTVSMSSGASDVAASVATDMVTTINQIRSPAAMTLSSAPAPELAKIKATEPRQREGRGGGRNDDHATYAATVGHPRRERDCEDAHDDSSREHDADVLRVKALGREPDRQEWHLH